jgi:hypothetical protein
MLLAASVCDERVEWLVSLRLPALVSWLPSYPLVSLRPARVSCLLAFACLKSRGFMLWKAG